MSGLSDIAFFSIHRIVTKDDLPNSIKKRIQFASYCIEKTCNNIDEKVNLIQTPGGFLIDEIDLSSISTGRFSRKASFQKIIKEQSIMKQILTNNYNLIL